MHRAKDFIHNLGESIADCMEEHSTCVDLDCPEDMRKIIAIGEVSKAYNRITEFMRNYCAHKDGSLYRHGGDV